MFLLDSAAQRFIDQRLIAAAAGAGTKILDDRHIQIHRQARLAAHWRLFPLGVRRRACGYGAAG